MIPAGIHVVHTGSGQHTVYEVNGQGEIQEGVEYGLSVVDADAEATRRHSASGHPTFWDGHPYLRAVAK